MEDLNNNVLTYQDKRQNSLNKSLFETENTNSEKQVKEQRRFRDHNENQEKCPLENQKVSQNVLKKKTVIQEDKIDPLVVSTEKIKDQSNEKSGEGDVLLRSKILEDTKQKSRSDPKLKNNSDREGMGPAKVSDKKSNASKESLEESKEVFSFESSDKYSGTLLANVKEGRLSGLPGSSKAQSRKRKKTGEEKPVAVELTQESENKRHLKHKHKKVKTKHQDKESEPEEPSMSFESYLNYDKNVLKRKKRCGVKKPPQKAMMEVKELTQDAAMKEFKFPVRPNIISEKQVCLDTSSAFGLSVNDQLTLTNPSLFQLEESGMETTNTPLPAVLSECEKPSAVEYFERKGISNKLIFIFILMVFLMFLSFFLCLKVEKPSDFCDISEESAVFTGQRLNKKMQVYSGAKTIFLPTMMSLHQQCIRTLQNNINCELK